jgi:KDO2-lipid IV(A) lauroyltransferase
MYYLLYGLLYVVSLLPFFILYGISDFAVFIIYDVMKYRKDVVMNNLDIAFPEKTKEERKKIARRFYRNLTDTFIESIKMMNISESAFLKRAKFNTEGCNAIAAKGKNIQFHSGHQFNWEYANWIVAMKLNIPWIGVYMKINNPAIDKLFFKLRSKKGTLLVAAQEFKLRKTEVFTKQYSLGLAADQNAGVPHKAYWLNFFGKPVPFVTGPDKGAILNNTAVVFVKFIKVKRGYYEFIPTVITEDGGSLKRGELTLMYRDFLEETIRQHPDNYLWSHRRWKWEYSDDYANRWIDVNPPGTK